MASKTMNHDDYTVGWVCALLEELVAASEMLDEEHQDLSRPPNDPNTYTLGRIGDHNVVIACLPQGEYNNASAATVASWMVSAFPCIKVGLMVGIGGGVPPVRLGDVVVSSPSGVFPGVVKYDFGKAEQGGIFRRTGALNSSPTSLRTALTKLSAQHVRRGSKVPQYLDDMGKKNPRMAKEYTNTESLKDVLFKFDYDHIEAKGTESCLSCDPTKIVEREARGPSDSFVHYGLIASGDQVIKNAVTRDRINEDLGGAVLCFEKEAAGLMNNFPCVVIRGICDYADSHKNDTWQKYAAAVAAAFAKELLLVVQVSDVKNMEKITCKIAL